MQQVRASCQPRPEILAGTFNPELFTARLSQVLGDYARGEARMGAASLYSDPVAFFRDATYPTQGLCSILDNVLARLVQGDASRPSMQRLDEAFGGGKTHTLIAVTHVAHQGQALAADLDGLVPVARLGQPGQIRVVGIIGDTVDTIRESAITAEASPTKPNTLWWLIAQQTLTPEQQAPIRARLEEASAPASEEFFDVLLGGQPTLILIDEIAQYLSRMEAAFPGIGAEQSAAFLMSLSTYAAGRAQVAVVLSLASASNAFGDFNQLVRKLQDKHGMTQAQAEAIVAEAQRGMLDVVNRTSEATTPVQQGDLSRILAKRLFSRVDQAAAAEVAEAFINTYRQAGTDLPSGARDPQLRERLIAHYPFHPTLIEFLSQELAQVESFQSTRGLLRTLARAVRRIWDDKLDIPLIQTGHIDLADSAIRSELLGKTRNTDLQAVLDSDISKVAGTAATSLSVAGELDRANPHPDGYPVHEWAWRVVFLHSLVGRGGGLSDDKFGIDMTSAVYEMASPAIKPATVHSALEQIEREANFLRNRQGRLYADTVPTLNNILRRIEGSVREDEAEERVAQVVRKLIEKSAVFDVHPNITDSEAIPDKTAKPQLGVLAFTSGELDPAQFVEQRGSAIREHQNLVFLLAPSTLHLAGATWSETRVQQERRVRHNILTLARKAMAVERLTHNPENWNVTAKQLQQPEFKERAAKTPNELLTAVGESYRYLLFPGRDGGRVVVRDLGKSGGPTGGGSGGLHLESAILKQLEAEGELITQERAITAETLTLVGKLFFDGDPQVKVSDLVSHFATRRHWPILQAPELLTAMLLEGCKRDLWCLLRFPESSPGTPAAKPTELYHKDNPPPVHAEPLAKDQAWLICTKLHAKQLGWLEDIERRPDTVATWVEQTIASRTQLNTDELTGAVEQEHDRVDPNMVRQQVANLLAQRKLVLFPSEAFGADGSPDPEQAQTGDTAPLGDLTPGLILPYHEAQARGWIRAPEVKQQQFALRGEEPIKQVLNLLAGTALAQSQTQVTALQISAQLPDQARVQLALGPSTVGALVESRNLFAALNSRLRFASGGELRLTVTDPDPNCKFIQFLKQVQAQPNQ